MRWGCATLLIAFALGARAANADEVERIAVDYQAPALCPNEDAFVDEIAARTSKFRRVHESAGVRVIRVKLSEEPGQSTTRGELVLTEGEAESVRVVHDANCAVVVSGLALIAALAIDPEAETGPVDRLAPPPAKPPPAPEPPPPVVAPPPIPKPHRRVETGIAIGGAGRVGPVPLEAAATLAGIVGLADVHGLRPEGRLELSAALPRTESLARLAWFGGHVEGCGLYGPGAFRAGPCALVELGAVHAAGVGAQLRDAQSTTRFGLSAGAGARLALVRGSFFGELAASLLVPFRRDRFYVDPRLTVFQSAAVGGQFGADVGVRF